MARRFESMADEPNIEIGNPADIVGIDFETVLQHANEYEALKGNVAEAAAQSHAKMETIKGMGANTNAVKAFLKLNNMSDEKRLDFMRTFTGLVAQAGWDAQSDMFEPPAAKGTTKKTRS